MDQITKNSNLTKAEQEATAVELSNFLLENSNCLEALMKLKSYENIINSVKKSIEAEAINEADKYGKGQHEVMGVKFQVKEGSRRYDYTNDDTYNKLKAELKEREEFLKGLKKPMVDPETGELAQPPIEKYTKSSITISFPK